MIKCRVRREKELRRTEDLLRNLRTTLRFFLEDPVSFDLALTLKYRVLSAGFHIPYFVECKERDEQLRTGRTVFVSTHESFLRLLLDVNRRLTFVSITDGLWGRPL